MLVIIVTNNIARRLIWQLILKINMNPSSSSVIVKTDCETDGSSAAPVLTEWTMVEVRPGYCDQTAECCH